MLTPGDYRFMSNGNVKITGLDDVHEFEDTVEAMNIMQFTLEEQSGN